MKYIQNSLKGFYFYLILILSSISIYALFTVYTGIDMCLNISPKRLVTCSTPDAVPSYVFQDAVYLNFVSLVFNILLLIVINKNGNKLQYFFIPLLLEIDSSSIINHGGPLFISDTPMQIAGCILVPVLACYI